MNEINFNHERPYKKLSNSKLHQIKNDIDIRLAHRSLAEAEIAYRKERRQKYTFIVAVISLLATLIFNFCPWMINTLAKISWP